MKFPKDMPGGTPSGDKVIMMHNPITNILEVTELRYVMTPIVQSTGTSTTQVMSQDATTKAINAKVVNVMGTSTTLAPSQAAVGKVVDAKVVNAMGQSTTEAPSQKAVSDELKMLRSAMFNAGTNRVSNGAFIYGLSDWSQQAATCKVVADTLHGYPTNCLEVTASAGAYTMGVYGRLQNMIKGETYVFVFWYKIMSTNTQPIKLKTGIENVHITDIDLVADNTWRRHVSVITYASEAVTRTSIFYFPMLSEDVVIRYADIRVYPVAIQV